MNLEQTLKKLVSFQTVTGNVDEARALVEWVKDELQPVPLHVREYEYHGLPSLVITPTRRKRARLWLAAHFDVVAAPQGLFRAKRAQERLLGRGVIDMKFAIACYMRLLHDIGAHMQQYDVGVMLTPDEEWGRDSAVKFLLEKDGYTGDVVFLPDGYGSWKFEEAAKGFWGVSVTTQGVAAHSSKPWHGRNAIHELADFLADAHREVEKAFPPTGDDAHWYTTMTTGTIAGGTAFNMIPAEATATLDVRYTCAKDRDQIEAILKRLLKTYKHTTLQVTHRESPYGMSQTNGYAKTFARIAKEKGAECGWVKAHGASDARFFNRAGMPTVLISPHGGDSHSDTEWIDIQDLELYYAVLKQYVEEVARK